MKAWLLIITVIWASMANSLNIWSMERDKEDPTDYGVDFSFPIHHYQRGNTPIGAHFKRMYERFMKGCYDRYSRQECDANELSRMEMNRNQPRSHHNYTDIGFLKTKTPKEAWEPLIDFYRRNREKEKLESWPRGNTYTNNWESLSSMISFEDRSLRGGLNVKEAIWNGVKPVIEAWVGRKIKPTSLYGIRLYKSGAILNPHVDRMPLVSSCIINVDQDVDEPWFAELYSRDGKAHNVTMEPGDMVLYESHTTIHGRPFPMKGRFYANIFVHFIPLDHDEQNDMDPTLHPDVRAKRTIIDDMIHSSKTVGGHEADNHDSETVERHMNALKGEEEAEHPDQDDIDALEEKEYPGHEYSDVGSARLRGEKLTDGRTILHSAAARGDLDVVKKILQKPDRQVMLHSKDENEWQPIHEAVRGGHLDTLKYLVDKGADVGTKTKNGGTALWWARRVLEPGHAVITFLEDLGAPEEGEDL